MCAKSLENLCRKIFEKLLYTVTVTFILPEKNTNYRTRRNLVDVRPLEIDKLNSFVSFRTI